MKTSFMLPALALADGHLASEISHAVELKAAENGIIQAAVQIDVSDPGYVSFGFGPASGAKMANAEIVLFKWTDAQDVQLEQYQGVATNGMPTLLDNAVWKIKSEELDSDGKINLVVEKDTADPCDACMDPTTKGSLIWAHGTVQNGVPSYHSGRGFVADVTPNAGYGKKLTIPPSDHADDHGDHSDPDHSHDDETTDDHHDNQNDDQHSDDHQDDQHSDDDGHSHGPGGSAAALGAAAASWLATLFFSL